MEKSVNILRFPKLGDLLNKMIECLDLEWSKIVDSQPQMHLKEIKNVRHNSINLKIEESNVLIEIVIKMGADFSEKCYIFMSFKDAVMISGLYLKEDVTEIEKLIGSSSLNNAYTESFENFCKKTVEGMNNVFTNNLPIDTELEYVRHLLTPKDNKIVKEIFPEDDDQIVFSLSAEYSLPGKEDRLQFSLLFPLELVESFFGETVYFDDNKTRGRILVVDDSRADISLIRKLLRNKGYLVMEGKDEQSTLHMIFSEKIDLILLDIYLEEENGLSICRRIRRNMLCDYIPVIMFSWGATKDNIVKSLRVGAQDFLAKPFNKDILLNKIKKHISEKSSVNLMYR